MFALAPASAPAGYDCCAETTLDGVAYARVASDDATTCCSGYCTYDDGGSSTLQYISMMSKYVASSSTAVCFSSGSVSVDAQYSTSEVAAGCTSSAVVADVAFTERVITTLADRVNSVFAIDVDGDGDVDVLSASYDDDTVAWYENDGTQSFTEHVITDSANGAKAVFDDTDDTVAWYENDGSQSFTERVTSSSRRR